MEFGWGFGEDTECWGYWALSREGENEVSFRRKKNFERKRKKRKKKWIDGEGRLLGWLVISFSEGCLLGWLVGYGVCCLGVLNA